MFDIGAFICEYERMSDSLHPKLSSPCSDALALQVKSVEAGAPHVPLVAIDDYPQLRAVCWSRRVGDTCTEREALSLYERQWRFVDAEALMPKERAFIDHLVKTYGNGVLMV